MAALTFSVGIPTFNQAAFLEQTIESLLRQTRPPDEIVISDHHSTDHTPAVIARYQGRVRSLQPPPGANLTGQYNFTLASQTCDWISLFSSDDIARPNFCEVLSRAAASRPDAVLARAGWENIDTQGQSVSVNYLLSVPKVEQPPHTLITQARGPKVSFAAFAVKRKAYEESGPIFAPIESLADWALFLQIAPFGSFVYEHALIADYRVGDQREKYGRLGMWIRDQQRIFTEVMPLAAKRASLADTSFIARAEHANFLRYLASASRKFTPAQRAEPTLLFADWAAAVGQQALLQRFTNGETIKEPTPLSKKIRTALRPLAQGVAQRAARFIR